MEKMILVRYGEIHLKGLNKPFFEKLLLDAIRRALKPFEGAQAQKGDGRYYVRGVRDEDFDAALAALGRVFGVHSISPAVEVEKTVDAIAAEAVEQTRGYLARNGLASATFKVESKRSDKRFPLNSMQLSAEIGGRLLQSVPGLRVDVHKPALTVHVEVRENAFVYVDILPGQGGMPIGSSGKAVLLLSGGIDSPVAGHMIAKRGVVLEAVHFESFPYTSERAREKVISLARILARYTGEVRLHLVHFTDIQMEIYEKCPPEQLTILMRRFMMKIAERIARAGGAQALVTGESIGQVASQTVSSLVVTNAAVELPVFRPLIGMDKIEIIERAKALDTYETSILPYEDCCTVFVPKHPSTRPVLERIVESERLLDGEALITAALERTQVMEVRDV